MSAKPKGFPYVPFYLGDFLRSTAGWTLLERGAYWMLLATQWEIGPLPEDPTRRRSRRSGPSSARSSSTRPAVS